MEYLNNKSSRNADNNIDKLPFFLNKSGSPKSWFQLLEAKFEFSALSASSKFYQAASCLPPDIFNLLSDELVEASTSCNPYNSLKELLIDHYKTKPNEVIYDYFKNNSKSQIKPSEFLEKAIEELESKYPGITKNNDQILRKVFILSLPVDVQKIVNGISNIELSKLANFADKMYEKEKPNNATNFDDNANINSFKFELTALKLQFLTLQEKFDRLEEKVNFKSKLQPKQHSSLLQSSPRPSSPTKAFSSNHSFKDKNKEKHYCFYHIKYGTGAQKCQIGCTYSSKSPDLKISNICIFHAKYGTDSTKCLPGCSRYATFNLHSSR